MKLNKSWLKGSLLLSSVFVLTACTDTTQQNETTVAETTVAETTVAETTVAETTVAETTVAETTVVETTEAETTEAETTEKSEEASTEESKEESTEKSEEASTEESKEESTEKSEEESTEKSEEESTEKSEEESTEESKEESTEKSEEASTEESKEESTEKSEEASEVVPATGDQKELQDGEYTAVSNTDEHGWAVKHTIVVKDGKITESNYDYVNAEGKVKSEDEEYNTKMKEVSGVSGKEAMEQLNKALVEKQDPNVDIVTGATSTSSQFVFSSKALIKAAQEGNTEEINIDELPLNDGEFSVQGEMDEHGWSPVLSMVVKDGKITEVTFDYVNAEGAKKSEDEEYNTKMKEASGVSGKEAMEQLAAALVEKQNLAEVDVVTGATSTSETFIQLAKQLIQASQLQEAPAEETNESEASEAESTEAESTEAETTEETSAR